MKKLYIFLLTFFLFTVSTSIIKANQIIFSEDFSSSLSGWTVVQSEGNGLWERCANNGNPAHWILDNGWLDITLDGPDCTTVIMPNNFNLDGIDTYKIEFDWFLNESIAMDRNALLAWQDKNNWYGLRIYKSNIYFEKVINGIVTHPQNSRTIFPFQADNKYHFTLSYLVNNRITVEIDGQIILDMVDQSPFLNNKNIGLKASLNLEQRSISQFDNIIVTSLDENSEIPIDTNSIILDVLHFKQNDPLWAENEYDSANSWSDNPTIKRWGCALSSMSMILNYHKINKLPSGEVITPDSLNNWLNQQPDGYVGEGLLNWMAITRLTRQISNILGTPKLEYSRVNGNLIETTIDQIKSKKPVILNIFGHFLVSNGFTNNLLDLLILDPLYKYNLFSEHETSLLSTRIFTPSFTDLSYIMVVTDPNIEVEILDSNNQIPSNLEQFSEILSSDSEIDGLKNTNQESEIKQYKITQIAKPQTDNYKINFSKQNTTNNNPSGFSIYSYDDQGTATIFKENIVSLNSKETYELNYQKESSATKISTINKIVTWQSLLQTIENITSEQLISDIISNYLIKIINWASLDNIDNQRRYITLLSNYLNKISIIEEIRLDLLSDLNYLKDSI